MNNRFGRHEKLKLKLKLMKVEADKKVKNSLIVIFHGGCHGCTQQAIQPSGLDYCVKCQYFDADWDLPNLNNEEPNEADEVRNRLKKEHGIADKKEL